MPDIDKFIKTGDCRQAGTPKVALPPHLKSFRHSHVAKAGLAPLGQIVKPGDPRYAGQDKNGKPLPPKSSSRPTLLKRVRIKK
jgi:hypothetical protein